MMWRSGSAQLLLNQRLDFGVGAFIQCVRAPGWGADGFVVEGAQGRNGRLDGFACILRPLGGNALGQGALLRAVVAGLGEVAVPEPVDFLHVALQGVGY